jgi:hypothetical protein
MEPHEPDKKGSNTFAGEITRLPGRKGTDYTEEQEEHWQTYLNWYDEHPQYDDRHEQYC